MKTKNLSLRAALIAGLGLILAGRVTAQTFTTLYSFSAISTNSSGVYTNSDGAGGNDLILSGNTLYGTAGGGGSSGNGTVFAVNTDGTGFTTLHSFTATPSSPAWTNSDGALPHAGLILSGSTLYGTAVFGGSSGHGTVFKVNTGGASFTTLHSFTGGSDGYYPYARLILSANTLFGTARGGGSSDRGTVFAINTDGTSFTTLHSFTGGSDGAYPVAGLITNSSGNTLYGTAQIFDSSDAGTVFAVNTDGTGFTNLHTFTAAYTNSAGATPYAGLILSSNILYGTTDWPNAYGTVFKVNTDGTGFTTLYSFPHNVRGSFIQFGRLILSGSTLYGTAGNDLIAPFGIVFAVNTDGSGFTSLYSFSGLSVYDGAIPEGLILSGNTLYGTFGGISSDGMFGLTFAPRLTIGASDPNVVLTWPINVAGFGYAGFTLQSTRNLVSPVVWTAVTPEPGVVNGQNAATNPISGTQKFYRLSRQ
jgi:uncharacterized repeat protein (TIGR03803 family)